MIKKAQKHADGGKRFRTSFGGEHSLSCTCFLQQWQRRDVVPTRHVEVDDYCSDHRRKIVADEEGQHGFDTKCGQSTELDASTHPHTLVALVTLFHFQAHLEGNIATPTPAAKKIRKQRAGATAAFSISRPTPPSGIGGGGGAGCAGSRGKTPNSAETKRRTLASIPHEIFSRQSSPLHPSAASSTRLAAVKPVNAAVGTIMEAYGGERPARRRRFEAERTDDDRGCRDADTCSGVDEMGGGRGGVAPISEQNFRREMVAENVDTVRHGERDFEHMSRVGMDAIQWTRPPGMAGSDGDQWLTQGDADILIEGNSQWLTQDETGGGVWMSQNVTMNNDQRRTQTGGGDDRRPMSWGSQARGGDGIQSTTQGSQREDQRVQKAEKGRHVNGRAAGVEGCQVTGSGGEGFTKREVQGPSDDAVRG